MSRSSPVAGPSRSPTPTPPSTYRIERFESSSSANLMVTSRSKRSTAGNRLKALLDQELDKDEIFAEVENDIDFEANENEDGVDIVDSDFDRDSDDDARAAADESEGEREIEAQEKAEKSKRRAAARAVGVVRRPAAPVQRPARRPAPETAGEGSKEVKRRRISFAPDQPSPSSSQVSGGRRRTSARSATVQSKLEVESRLEEASQRRAALPARPVVKKKATLTQDALIAEALEVEEENRESLRRFLEQEEERRAKQRQRKERITGPFVRWVSVGLKTKVVEELPKAEDKEQRSETKAGAEGESARASTAEDTTAHPAAASYVRSASIEAHTTQDDADRSGITEPNGTVTLPKRPEASADAEAKEASRSIDVDATMADASKPAEGAGTITTQADPTTSEAMPSAAAAPSVPPPPPTTPPSSSTTQPTSLAPTPALASATNAALTLDPVIAARQQAALLRTTTNTATTPSTSSTTAPSSRYELQSRTILTVERAPDFTWLDEFNVLLGSHVDWSAYPFVPSRNRPLKPRQSICPITGLPAVYKDPRTGIPFANSFAYKVLTRVLEGGFVWSGGHYERRGEDEGKGKKKERRGREAGAVPIEMGVYLDDEAEQGPGKVWDTARSTAPAPKAVATPAKTPAPSKAAPTSKATSTPSNTVSTEPDEAKKKSKPGFDVVLTNAIAPGDEKSVLAAALSLPAGSTRSGRRARNV
ncbi:YL1 nuclear, C-terminal [Kalmanozyma brasiliensis GHG001]|uniref:Vps72/YL1 C-terminal domain-containing protein n=1 Tax=Kalmanozyma brasiliensis (strain GHG001) TaxID=1365824 RepID=V5EXR5_KALBG|nr:YL1 nuclear, C-terminal [Kalmanozyma brasiliensis GHG001]EST07334.1 YL1 nuclear, C-terminal [Kalmanozyma brasiliensis GHG001]